MNYNCRKFDFYGSKSYTLADSYSALVHELKNVCCQLSFKRVKVLKNHDEKNIIFFRN